MKCQQSKGDVNPSSYSKNYFKLVIELTRKLKGENEKHFTKIILDRLILLNVFYTIYF